MIKRWWSATTLIIISTHDEQEGRAFVEPRPDLQQECRSLPRSQSWFDYHYHHLYHHCHHCCHHHHHVHDQDHLPASAAVRLLIVRIEPLLLESTRARESESWLSWRWYWWWLWWQWWRFWRCLYESNVSNMFPQVMIDNFVWSTGMHGIWREKANQEKRGKEVDCIRADLISNPRQKKTGQ